jgi:hypothetical protein
MQVSVMQWYRLVKKLLIDCQGNWGISLLEIARQLRYIEARLSKFALEVFTAKITDWGCLMTVASGTNLPVKFPLLCKGQKVLQ